MHNPISEQPFGEPAVAGAMNEDEELSGEVLPQAAVVQSTVLGKWTCSPPKQEYVPPFKGKRYGYAMAHIMDQLDVKSAMESARLISCDLRSMGEHC